MLSMFEYKICHIYTCAFNESPTLRRFVESGAERDDEVLAALVADGADKDEDKSEEEDEEEEIVIDFTDAREAAGEQAGAGASCSVSIGAKAALT